MKCSNGDCVQVKLRGSQTPKRGRVEIADRLDGLVSVRMDNGAVWTVSPDEVLPATAPVKPVDCGADKGP